MPSQPATICSRCRRIIYGRCQCRKRYDRGTTKERGYAGSWPEFRRWFLTTKNWLCEDCGAKANEVHHIIKLVHQPELRLVASNCMALCGKCHKVRTARGE